MWIGIEDKVFGYNQAQVNIDCYINPEAWLSIPSVPYKRKGYGSILFFVVKKEGRFKSVNPTLHDEIKNMSSCQYCEFFLKQDKIAKKTIDCFTWGGLVSLYNEENDLLMNDYNRLREMEDLPDFFILV